MTAPVETRQYEGKTYNANMLGTMAVDIFTSQEVINLFTALIGSMEGTKEDPERMSPGTEESVRDMLTHLHNVSDVKINELGASMWMNGQVFHALMCGFDYLKEKNAIKIRRELIALSATDPNVVDVRCVNFIYRVTKDEPTEKTIMSKVVHFHASECLPDTDRFVKITDRLAVKTYAALSPVTGTATLNVVGCAYVKRALVFPSRETVDDLHTNVVIPIIESTVDISHRDQVFKSAILGIEQSVGTGKVTIRARAYWNSVYEFHGISGMFRDVTIEVDLPGPDFDPFAEPVYR